MLVISCSITNYPKLSDSEQQPSLSQFPWFRNARAAQLAGCFWPRFPACGRTQEAAGAPDSRSSVHFSEGSLAWLLAGGLRSRPSGPLHRSLRVLSMWQGEHGGSGTALYEQVPRPVHLRLTVTVRQKPGIRSSPNLGRAVRFHLLKRRVSKNVWRCCETTKSTMCILRL